MGILDIFKKNTEKSARFKEMQLQAKLDKILEERGKTSNERELERFYEEERQKAIKKNLQEFRDHRHKEAMKTTVLSGGDIFKGQKENIASGPTTVLKNNNKLFSLKKGIKQRGMFFK